MSFEAMIDSERRIREFAKQIRLGGEFSKLISKSANEVPGLKIAAADASACCVDAAYALNKMVDVMEKERERLEAMARRFGDEW